MKTCKTCNEEKPLSEFSTTKVRDTRYPRSSCKQCLNAANTARYKAKVSTPEARAAYQAYRKEYRKQFATENSEAVKQTNRKRRWARQGMDPEIAEAYYQAHDGLCEICGIAAEKFHMDHNHATGKIRGMLCHHCNALLGFSRESPRIMIAAIDYLERKA